MLKPLNYFKQIQCPQNVSCNRPYCLFKHTSQSLPQPSLTPTPSTQASIPSYSTASNDTSSSTLNNLLPSAIQNLATAFQTVQNLIGSNDPNLLTQKLTEIITQAAQTSTSHTQSITKSQIDQIKPKPHKEKSKLPDGVPDYNPTPISELNKSKSDESFEEIPDYEPSPIKKDHIENEIQIKKRKISENYNDATQLEEKDSIISNKKSKDSSENELKKHLDQKANTIVKRMQNPTYFEAASSLGASSSMKIDKLSLQQQLAKRYEIINKQKKSQDSSSTPKSNSTPSSTENVTQPKLIMDNTCKVSLILRQRYLKLIFEECKNQHSSVQKACEMASEQEKSIYDRCKTKAIYCNLAVNLIKTLRAQNPTPKQITNQPNTGIATKQQQIQSTGAKLAPTKFALNKQTSAITAKTTISHEQMLNGVKSTKVSYSINRKKSMNIKDLSPEQVHNLFRKYILTEKQLLENCFPYELKDNPNFALIPPKPNGNTQLSTKQTNQNLAKNTENKNCKRCSKLFTISKDYRYLSIDECVHHWGKLRTIRVNKFAEQKYSCCNGDTKSDGCQVGKHVYDGDDLEPNRPIPGFINTKNSSLITSQTTNIYALDCEMCYTTKGLELTRVSVIDINLKPIYETLVKPDYDIIDYNTRWSGITQEDLKNCKIKLANVQEHILKIFNKDTILIGHSLDSDFKALKLIHKTVVDTSVVFPHRLGPPMKRALKNLTSEFLQKIIQDDTDGHDSKEDACACMELMLWKVQQDIKN